MAQIFPFKAFRYQLSQTKLSKALCPPYDIIGPKLEKQLRQNPLNAVHVELPEGTSDDKYVRAKETWQEWRNKGIVRQDTDASFYIYEQSFTVNRKQFVRKGFFSEVQIEKPGAGAILRHELTLSQPKEDRLKLLRSVQINTSPIFGIFRDPKSKIRDILNWYSKGDPIVQFTDSDHVTHKLWQFSDPLSIQRVQLALGNASIFIADGHHRYETAWNYVQEMKVASELENGNPSSRVLFFLCPVRSPGLVIFPTHRVWKERTELSQILARLKSCRDVFELKEAEKPVLHRKNSFLVTDGKNHFFVKVRSFAALRKHLRKFSKNSLNISLVQIHSLLYPGMKKEDFIYTHDQRDAVELAKKNKTVTFLVPPTSVQHLISVVSSGDLMPQKSTYFYPKIITGLVFRSL